MYNDMSQMSQDRGLYRRSNWQVFSASDTVVPVRPTREDGVEGEEDVFLPGKPETLLASGNFHNVPYLTGVNSREAIIYVKGQC
jgi:hypothetical protein